MDFISKKDFRTTLLSAVQWLVFVAFVQVLAAWYLLAGRLFV
jgi:hypothetical protein